MRILIAPDKFKGSLSAREVAENIAAGLRAALPAAEFTLLPLADGGEGTAEAICTGRKAEWATCLAQDANGNAIRARYAMLDEGGGATAVFDTSEAIGLWRIPEEARDPMRASSFGVGEMLRHVANCGANKVIVGLGGSATNDGGVGMARALGFRFLDCDGNPLSGSVAELWRLHRIERPAALVLPEIIAATDVRNPLLGERGATRVFAAQKGATPVEHDQLEAALTRLAEVVARDFGRDQRDVAGAGAAGGLGFGFVNFAGATLRSGFEVVAEFVGLEEAVRAADVVITGEGRLDAQTLEGKAVAGVASLAKRCGRPCFAMVGQVRDDAAWEGMFEGVCVLGTSSKGEMAQTGRLLRELAPSLVAALGQASRQSGSTAN